MHESTHAFGPDQGLIGTLTLPAAHTGAPAAPCGMVLFNAGVVHRVGPHRINVKLARELARHGIPSIRFDLHGMGDSLGADGQRSYPQQVVLDLQAAMDMLQAATGVQRFTLLGFCSGALPSYWTAQQDTRVRHIILYDAFSLQTAKSRRLYLVLRLRNHGFSPAALALYFRRVACALGALPSQLQARLSRNRAERAHDGVERLTRAKLAERFAALAQRNVRVTVLHSGADFSNVNHPEQIVEAIGIQRAGVAGLDLQTGFLMSIDHIVTSISAQGLFIDFILTAVLGGCIGVTGIEQHARAGLATPARSVVELR